MNAPPWIEALVADFGAAAGLDSFALNERGAASVVFSTGYVFRLEYVHASLAVMMEVPTRLDGDIARSILSYSEPGARRGFTIRSGYFTKAERAVFVARMAERDATLPALNAIFAEFWRIANEFGGAA